MKPAAKFACMRAKQTQFIKLQIEEMRLKEPAGQNLYNGGVAQKKSATIKKSPPKEHYFKH